MKYAIKYAHGHDVLNGTGYVYRFQSKRERDDWVALGSPYIGPNEREALVASHKLVKRAKEHHEEGLEWPIQVTI